MLRIFLALAVLASAQEVPTIRSTTRLVTVNVVVSDKKGRPVEGLTQEDFQVLDNGAPAQIRFFAAESAAAAAAPGASTPPEGIVSNEFIRKAAPHTINVILFDTVNTPFSDLSSARQQVMRYLSKIGPEDHVGLYVLGSDVRIVHEFTDSLESLRQKVANGAIPSQVHPSIDNQVIRTFGALEAIAQHLSGQPGRKNLIWISSAYTLIPDIGGMAGKSYEDLKPSEAEIKLTWPAALNHALLALSGADVAVYCVDARRLSAEPQWEPTTWGDFSRGGRPGRPPAVSPRPMATSKNRTMIEIASHTGGSAYFDTNDIKSVVRNIVEGSRLSYSLGFYPASARGDGSLHTISVRVDRRGVSVHSRRGYFDTPEEPSPENSFRAMLASSLEATGLGLTARARLIEPTRLAVEVQVEPDGLTSREKAGKPIVQLDLALVPIDEGGIKCPCAMEPVTRELLRTGVKFDGALEFAQTATMLRVLVRDRLSGAMGSVTIPASKFRH